MSKRLKREALQWEFNDGFYFPRKLCPEGLWAIELSSVRGVRSYAVTLQLAGTKFCDDQDMGTYPTLAKAQRAVEDARKVIV